MTESPARRPTRTPFVAAAIAIPALSIGIAFLPLAANASTPVPQSLFAVQAAKAGAVVTKLGGAVSTSHHLLAAPVAVAGDGSVDVLRAVVAPNRFRAVLLDNVAHTARLLGIDPAAAGLHVTAGDSAVVLHTGTGLGGFSAVDVTTGRSSALTAVPAPATGITRKITAIAAEPGGALVATSDIASGNSTGAIPGTDIWELTAGAATSVAHASNAFLVAVAATPVGIDALEVSSTDESVALLQVSPAGAVTTEPVGLTLPNDVIAADLGFTSGLTPIATLTAASGTSIESLDGTVLGHYAAGVRVFASAGDVRDPKSVLNPVPVTARLTGVPKHDVDFKTKVTPVADGIASGLVQRTVLDARLVMTQGRDHQVITSGRSHVLRENTCFTVSVPATVYSSAAKPESKCVDVDHKLVVTSMNKKRHAVISTTARKLMIEVHHRGRWTLARHIKVGASGIVKLTVPNGAVRVVAVATAKNAEATVQLTKH